MARARHRRRIRPVARVAGPVALAALAVLSAACGAGRPSAAPAPVPTRWVAIGDSYSAGHGGSRALVADPTTGRPATMDDRCGRAEADSYARRAAALLPDGAVNLTVAACGGALLADVTGQLDGVGPADLISVTIGGNDIGFAELLAGCATGRCPDLASDGADLPRVDGGADGGGDGRTDWEILAGTLQRRFGELLARLGPGGTLLVLTYPVPFPEQAGACPTGVAAMQPADAALVNAAVTRLDDAVVAAAGRAGQAVPDRQVRVLEWRGPEPGPLPTTPWRTPAGSTVALAWNPAGICGSEPMLNGLRFDAEPADSFHPSDRGLDLAAQRVAGAVAEHLARPAATKRPG